MSRPLLAAKLHVPPVRQRLVARPRLFARLDESLSQAIRLTLVSAPAGFGKTTLVSEWVHGLQAQTALGQPSVGWLSLDAQDDDPALFWTYVVSALQASRQGIAQQALGLLQAISPPNLDAFLTLLLNDLEQTTGPILLILDDYHLIRDQDIHKSVGFLVEHLPPHVHLILAARVDPPLPLPLLRGRGQLLELRMSDLRFSNDEASAYLNEGVKLALPEPSVAELNAKTEGWAAGLQIAALTMQGRTDLPRFVRSFGGHSRHILDYLADEVLDRQAPAVKKFLLRTSILAELQGSLCDALLESAGDSQAILEDLERANLFLVPLDEERQWYRYHHLFGDLLQKELQRNEPQMVAELHRRAGAWYEQNELLDKAAMHALKAGDLERAATLLEQIAWQMIMRGELTTLTNWVQALGAAVDQRPWISIYQAWALIMIGRTEECERWFRRVETQLSSGPADARPDQGEMLGYLSTIRASMACMQDDGERAVRLCQAALNTLAPDNKRMRCLVASLLGNARLIHGEVAGVYEAWLEAAQLAKASGSLQVTVNAMDSIAYLSLVKGELHRAADISREGIQLSTLPGGQPLPIASCAYARLAAVYGEWNHMETALRHAETSAALSRILARPNYLVQSHTVLARLRLAQGDLGGAVDLLREAEQVAERQALTMFADSLLAEFRMRVWLAQGDLAGVRQLAILHRLETDSRFMPLRESEYLMLARLYLAQGGVREALRLLERMLKAFEAYGWRGRVIEALILRALTLDAKGASDEALAALGQALSLAQSEGYVRLFVDEGKAMTQLLTMAVAKGLCPDYANSLLGAQTAHPSQSPAPIATTQPDLATRKPLNEREIEVLKLIAAGVTNKEIAQRLSVTVRTVKYYTTNIYDKLEVSGRAHAAARARELGLSK